MKEQRVHRDELIRELRKEILERAFVPKEKKASTLPNGMAAGWIFDMRPLLLKSKTLDMICELFWAQLEAEGPFQVGGLETASIPLISGMVMKGKERGVNVSGFYMRKSRRKDGLQKHIEGEITDEKIVLLDDALNSGKSFIRQLKVLEEAGKKVHAICVMIRFRDVSFYEYFRERGIKIFSLFTLDDFPATGGMDSYNKKRNDIPVRDIFSVEWKFGSNNPVYFHVVPKSAPAIDDERVYFGSDNGTMWALNQSGGSVAWSFKTLFGAGNKRIFSSPTVHDGLVYFGAYDGNVYALDAVTGEKRWVYMEADWIGSSPCVAPDLGLVFVGLEFGLWKKGGGLAALDLKTGEKKWWAITSTTVHSSPLYSAVHGVVVCGSTEGIVYAFRARDGKLLWRYATGGAVRASFAFDEKRGLVCFGSEDKYIYVLKTETGELVHKIETLEPVYSTPLVDGNRLYFGVLDKRMWCVDLNTGNVEWTFWTHSRVFSTPALAEGNIVFGSNDGRLYELDPKTGTELSYFQTTERIVNKTAYNPNTKRFFVPTYANEIYCLIKRARETAIT